MKEKKISNVLNMLVTVAGVISIVLGLTVITGWHTGAVTLIQVFPTFVPMQYNTAMGFLLSGLGIFAYIRYKLFRFSFVCGSLVAIVGILTLIEYLFYINLGIDELFMKHYVGVKTSHMGRMAPNTAISFMLTGTAIVIVCSCDWFRHSALITAILAAIIMGLGIIAFSGYLTGLESAYGWGHLTQMAVHTAFGFMVLGTGLFLLSWLKEKERVHHVPYWIPVPIAISVFTFSISLWQALHKGPGEKFAEHLAHHFILVFGTVLAFALALAVNLMQKSFRQNAVIKKAHDELELRVQERTAELANANRELLTQMAEREKAEKELEQKRRLAVIGEMSAHVAHEIRNPLNKVSLSYELLNNSKSIQGPDREALRIMGEEIDNLVSLATDLLDYGRKGSIKKESFKYSNFLEKIITEVEAKIDKVSIKIVKKMPQICSNLNADKVKIHQLVINILSNAIEAMPRGGTLTLEAKEEEGKLIITVTDTGTGVAKKDLNNIFMPFFTTKTSGTGLGMAISKQYANLHDGDILVDSEPGKGTKVTIILPLAA